jgi:hypothetical protein
MTRDSFHPSRRTTHINSNILSQTPQLAAQMTVVLLITNAGAIRAEYGHSAAWDLRNVWEVVPWSVPTLTRYQDIRIVPH